MLFEHFIKLPIYYQSSRQWIRIPKIKIWNQAVLPWASFVSSRNAQDIASNSRSIDQDWTGTITIVDFVKCAAYEFDKQKSTRLLTSQTDKSKMQLKPMGNPSPEVHPAFVSDSDSVIILKDPFCQRRLKTIRSFRLSSFFTKACLWIQV